MIQGPKLAQLGERSTEDLRSPALILAFGRGEPVVLFGHQTDASGSAAFLRASSESFLH